MNRIFIAGMLVVAAALAAIFSSLGGLGLLSAWPALILLIIFIRHYELGVLCFILSFGYQAPVLYAPAYGMSAVIRLDELVFAAFFIAWFLRTLRGGLRPPNAPLMKPLLFLCIIAVISLIARIDEMPSTQIGASFGIKGLIPLVFKLLEVVSGYWALSDPKLSVLTRAQAFWCFSIVAISATLIGTLVSGTLLPIDIVRNTQYDPNSWYTRLAVFGNTSAWGVLLSFYFFIILNTFLNSCSTVTRLICTISLALCINAVLDSASKTAVVTIITGFVLVALTNRRSLLRSIKFIIPAVIVIALGLFHLEGSKTLEQQDTFHTHFGQIYKTAQGLDAMYAETSAGRRVDNMQVFLEAIRQEPSLLLMGHGWHSRSSAVALHNDLLTACYDLGLLGVAFVLWFFSSMYRQAHRTEKSCDDASLSATLYALLLAVVMSSFMSENLTLYPGIDVQFPLLAAFFAIAWNGRNLPNSARSRISPKESRNALIQA